MPRYIELRDSIRTGDIGLFSGKGGLSEWIKLFTCSAWSHVGMAVRLIDMDMLLLLESTTLSNIRDVETGQASRGVQLVPLSERVKTFGGRVALRQLSKDLTAPMRRSLASFRREASGRPYERKHQELIKAAYDGPLGDNCEDLSSLFSSELVAEAYQRMGLLPDEMSSNEYTPMDFSTEARRPVVDLKRPGFSLMSEQWITS